MAGMNFIILKVSKMLRKVFSIQKTKLYKLFILAHRSRSSNSSLRFKRFMIKFGIFTKLSLQCSLDMITSVSLVCPFCIINKTNLLSRNTKPMKKLKCVCAHKLRICLVWLKMDLCF